MLCSAAAASVIERSWILPLLSFCEIMESVAVITGGNSGIGFAAAQRLLAEGVRGQGGGGVRVCLACRNVQKAMAARDSLLASYPGSEVDVLHIDVSSVASVKRAAAELQRRYQNVGWLYFNAGLMPVSGVNWTALWPPTFSNLRHQLVTGGDLLPVTDSQTTDGLKQVFATNLFGHFLLLQLLEDFLQTQGRDCHIIWTSSVAASRANFDPKDIQGKISSDPYAHSKKAVDLVSQEINTRMNHKGIYSSTTCPGLVATQLTYGILPQWVWSYLLVPLLLLLRVCMHSMTMSPASGAEALVWLASQSPSSLDHSHKFLSRATVTGHRYVAREQIGGSEELSREVWTELETLSRTFLS